MLGFGPLLEDYLDYNRNFKRLSVKTIKAYQVDIKQFIRYLQVQKEDINETSIKFYFMHLNENYRSTSVSFYTQPFEISPPIRLLSCIPSLPKRYACRESFLSKHLSAYCVEHI